MQTIDENVWLCVTIEGGEPTLSNILLWAG